MAVQTYSINISDVIDILESNLPEAELEMQLSALCANFVEIFELYGAAASAYLNTEKKEQAFECLMKAAEKAHQVYRNEQALEFYTQAAKLLAELPDKYEQYIAKINAEAGDVAGQLAKYDLAIDHYMTALENAPSEEAQAVYYRKLGEIYEEQADGENALKYFQMGLRRLPDVPSIEHARIYNGIGVIHFQKSEYSRAERQFNLALEVLSDASDDDTLALVYKNLGNVYRIRGRLTDAVRCYEQSLSLGKRVGDIFTQAKVYNNLGTCYKQRGDLNNSIECYQKSLELKEQIGDVAGLAPSYCNLGMLYMRQEDFARAIDSCKRGVEFAKQVGNLSRVAQSYINLGEVYAWQKHFKQAIDAYQKSREIAERIGDVRVVASLYVDLAEAYCGDGNLSSAYEYYSRTLEVLEAVEIPEIRAQANYVLGLIYSQQEDWEDATKALKQASEMFEKIRDKRGVEISQEELGKAFFTQMNQKLAIQQELSSGRVRLIGESKRFVEIGTILAKVAKEDAPILIRGETGTGKSILAHFIHQSSNRKNGPWVEIDCGALSETLLESELFGHERGAFTSAISAKPGKFELADHGTIFLDEIGNMSPALQKKLLRVLQEREFERVGGAETLKTDVRIITATNKDLERLVQEGQFREDLYYRINVVSITLPPLRERKQDIPLLAKHFVAKYSREYGKKSTMTISDETLELLLKYSWPGNVRELENVIQVAVLMTNSDVILPEHLTEKFRPKEKFEPSGISVGMTLEEMEKKLILKTLQQTNYNVTQSAKILGISRRTLQNKFKKFQISRPGEESEKAFHASNVIVSPRSNL